MCYVRVFRKTLLTGSPIFFSNRKYRIADGRTTANVFGRSKKLSDTRQQIYETQHDRNVAHVTRPRRTLGWISLL